jgi:hypothetical protein
VRFRRERASGIGRRMQALVVVEGEVADPRPSTLPAAAPPAGSACAPALARLAAVAALAESVACGARVERLTAGPAQREAKRLVDSLMLVHAVRSSERVGRAKRMERARPRQGREVDRTRYRGGRDRWNADPFGSRGTGHTFFLRIWEAPMARSCASRARPRCAPETCRSWGSNCSESRSELQRSW